jgi:hypothetical protein
MRMKHLLSYFLLWGALLLLLALALVVATDLRANDPVLAGLYGAYMTQVYVAPLALASLVLFVWSCLGSGPRQGGASARSD